MCRSDPLCRLQQCLSKGCPICKELKVPTVRGDTGTDVTGCLHNLQVTQPVILHGFAPNPYGGCLTLGPCQWKVRLRAGQFILGCYTSGGVLALGQVKCTKQRDDYHIISLQFCPEKTPTFEKIFHTFLGTTCRLMAKHYQNCVCFIMTTEKL